MPIRQLHGVDGWGPIHIIQVDNHGDEREEPNGTLLSDLVVERLRSTSAPVITDVILAFHGYDNDAASASSGYGAWMEAMARTWSKLDSLRRTPPVGFVPLLIGIAWPSMFLDPPTSSEAVHTATEVATRDFDGAAAKYFGPDWTSFSQDTRDSVALTFNVVSTFGFSRFVRRAQEVGKKCGYQLLGRLQREATDRPGQLPPVGFHLFGHSLGAHVALSTVRGPQGDGGDPHWREVDSLFLVQAAVRADCFASPHGLYTGLPEAAVKGVTVVTRSRSDRALKVMYRIAEGEWDGQLALGVVGVKNAPCYGVMLSPCGSSGGHALVRGRLYNAEASQVIESDIAAGIRRWALLGSHTNITSPALMRFLGEAAAVAR